MHLQIAHPAEHTDIADLPLRDALTDWSMDNVHQVLGLHRHVVKLVEFGHISYVVKELPDHLAMREFRLLREIDDVGLPTAEMVAVVTGRPGMDGMIITRHLDYSLPYRSLLMGRGLQIPYLGDRLLDALVALLVRVHLAGFFWGDCSLSNTLFRRDAGALQAYIIDVETAERHSELTEGQRDYDLMIATQNVAGGLLDLQAAGQLALDIDPIDVAISIGDRYQALWNEITMPTVATLGDINPMRQRLERLHDLGFAVDEMEVSTNDGDDHVKFIPKVVEHGYHAERLASLTGLDAGENQARRMLEDIKRYSAWLQSRSDRAVPLNVAAVRWLDRVFEPTIAAIPPDLVNRLEAAEIFHQLLEHRWFMNEREGRDVPLLEVLEDYVGLLAEAPEEQRVLDDDGGLDADTAALATPLGDPTIDPLAGLSIPAVAARADAADATGDEPVADAGDETGDETGDAAATAPATEPVSASVAEDSAPKSAKKSAKKRGTSRDQDSDPGRDPEPATGPDSTG